MPDFIPAVAGWYVEETEDGETSLDPVLAWKAATDKDGDDILLPFVDAGPGFPPLVLTEDSFKHCNRRVVYRPSHDPGRAEA
ncbi:hypothetical protein QBA54_31825 [Streptomyces sp. B21-108]|uniref:hypothetical protein n=1 Tax=Streptomyces sp. B21-108 TaxID=3039419 RepID=UPI002FF0535C